LNGTIFVGSNFVAASSSIQRFGSSLFNRLWYGEPDAVSNAIGYAKFYSRSHDAVIRIFDAAGILIETRDHAGDFREV